MLTVVEFEQEVRQHFPEEIGNFSTVTTPHATIHKFSSNSITVKYIGRFENCWIVSNELEQVGVGKSLPEAKTDYENSSDVYDS